MNVPFVELSSQYEEIRQPIEKAIERVLTEGTVIGGTDVSLFEQEFAQITSSSFCVGLNSGTDALILGTRALELPAGSEVIIPVNTFYASALAATENGLRPVFVDVDDEYGIDLDDLKRKLSKKTSAMCIVHLYGRADKFDDIKKIAHSYNPNIQLFEDAAQSHTATYKNKVTGSLGAFAAFSFYPTKNLGAYGDGGAITTNSAKLAKKIQLLHQYGQIKKYHHDILGVNSRLDTIQAAILSIKLKKLSRWISRRRQIANTYRTQLQSVAEIELPIDSQDRPSTYHLFVVRAKQRDALQKHLLSRSIHTQIHYPIPLHLQKAFSYLGYKRGDFPNAERHARQLLSLPIYPELTQQQLEYTCQEIHSFYS